MADRQTISDPVPTAPEVERLAIIMASAIGVPWPKAHAELARQLRTMANGALLHKGLEGHVDALRRLRAALEESIDTQRAAASRLGGSPDAEDAIKALYRGAMAVSTLLGVLDGQDPEDEKDDF